MRIGLDLRAVAGSDERLKLAAEADRLGLWAVLIGVSAGTEAIEGATIASRTDHVHLGLWIDGSGETPSTLAEEIVVVDHLSCRRALAVIDGDRAVVEDVGRLLGGQIVAGVALTPPPAQTIVPVWAAEDTSIEALTGDLVADREVIDAHLSGGTTHLFVSWPGPLPVLARHLVTRAVGPGFPQLVADLADELPGHRPG